MRITVIRVNLYLLSVVHVMEIQPAKTGRHFLLNLRCGFACIPFTILDQTGQHISS